MSKKFNSFDKRDYVVDLYKLPDPEKASLKKLIQALSCILRVLNSWRQKIDVENLDTHMKLYDQFKWLDDNSQFSCSIGFFLKGNALVEFQIQSKKCSSSKITHHSNLAPNENQGLLIDLGLPKSWF
jgi:hypothetical protein